MERVIYHLREAGDDLTVEVWSRERRNHARLLVDGEEVAAADTRRIGNVELVPESGPQVQVDWWWTGRVSRVALVERERRNKVFVPFQPPAGTRARRMYEFQREHPGLFAARHVANNLGGTVLALLGVGALLKALLPHIALPEWLRYLNPFRYLAPVFHWIGVLLQPAFDLIGFVFGPLFAWIDSWMPELGRSVHYVIGFIAACVIAWKEYRRRKKRDAAQQDSAVPQGSPAHETAVREVSAVREGAAAQQGSAGHEDASEHEKSREQQGSAENGSSAADGNSAVRGDSGAQQGTAEHEDSGPQRDSAAHLGSAAD